MALEERRDYCFSCTQGQKSLSVTVWDVHTGVSLRTYSCDAGCSGPGKPSNTAALCLLRESHLLCAPRNLPFVYVWNLCKEQVMLKIACAGLVRSLACSPDGVFCAGAIGDKIHFWHVCTGNLLAVVCQHYQPINVIKFSDDRVHLISGSEDSRVIVWRVNNVLSEASDQAPLSGSTSFLTRHIWSDHSLPVTDLHCGRGGLHSKVVTVSIDQTCKVYEITSGTLLCSILFDIGLTSVTLDLAEQWMFVGASNGKIFQVNLHLKLLGVEDASKEGPPFYCGHSKAISGLAVTSWAKLLVSTSTLEDTARVWDIASRQTIREFKHKGGIIKNLLSGGFLLPFSRKESVGEEARSKKSCATVVKPFKKQLHQKSTEGETRTKSMATIPIELRGIDPLCDLSDLQYLESLYHPPATHTNVTETDLSLQSARRELHELRDVHKKMYSFIMDKIIP